MPASACKSAWCLAVQMRGARRSVPIRRRRSAGKQGCQQAMLAFTNDSSLVELVSCQPHAIASCRHRPRASCCACCKSRPSCTPDLSLN